MNQKTSLEKRSNNINNNIKIIINKNNDIQKNDIEKNDNANSITLRMI